jgi:DNA repair exonuclease SbcCD ATPase subunit
MRRLITGVRTATAEQARSDGHATALASLDAPPAQEATPPLREHIAKLRGAGENAARAERLAARLDSLSAPPQIRDLTPLRTTIDNLAAARRAEAEADDAAATAVTELEAAEQEIAAWASANQACPTCGQSLSAEQAVAIVTGNGAAHDA